MEGDNPMNIKTIFWVIAFLALIGVVGQMDYEDEIIAEQSYIRDVCAGVYPDYKYLEPACDEVTK